MIVFVLYLCLMLLSTTENTRDDGDDLLVKRSDEGE